MFMIRYSFCSFVTTLGFLLALGGVSLAQSPKGNKKAAAAADAEWVPIERRLPPKGIEVPEKVRKQLADAIEELTPDDEKAPKHPVKEGIRGAFELALKHGEFYGEKDFEKIQALLDYARKPPELDLNNPQAGRYIAAYPSTIDGSWQPMALEVPENWNPLKPRRMIVWLHGRGDKVTNLHFLHQRLTKPGKLPLLPNTLVLHPFGRQSMGFKGPGEVDVIEATDLVTREFRIDKRRIALLGFSMGGAGVWHIGAHYPEKWNFIGPGAGFAETKEYNKLKPEDFPPPWEQKLWGLYDVPAYTGNLLNREVVVYSGAKDKQIQAARVMERAYAAEGEKLEHLIGPDTGHAYHPETLKTLMAKVDAALSRPLNELTAQPKTLRVHTRTLRYAKGQDLEIVALEKHWEDSRLEVVRGEKPTDGLTVTTKNVKRFRFANTKIWTGPLRIDGQDVVKMGRIYGDFERNDGTWARADYVRIGTGPVVKREGMQGPIDDAFMKTFKVLAPDPMQADSEVDPDTYFEKTPAAVRKWLAFEVAHLRDRWSALYRATLPELTGEEVNKALVGVASVVVWGTPMESGTVRRLVDRLPVEWDETSIRFNGQSWDARHHVLSIIYPNPYSFRGKYVVLNSGPTFREGHDRTNSLQNPKLPDWAVIDVREPPTGLVPGKIVAAGFFDEAWTFPSADNDEEEE